MSVCKCIGVEVGVCECEFRRVCECLDSIGECMLG